MYSSDCIHLHTHLSVANITDTHRWVVFHEMPKEAIGYETSERRFSPRSVWVWRAFSAGSLTSWPLHLRDYSHVLFLTKAHFQEQVKATHTEVHTQSNKSIDWQFYWPRYHGFLVTGAINKHKKNNLRNTFDLILQQTNKQINWIRLFWLN